MDKPRKISIAVDKGAHPVVAPGARKVSHGGKSGHADNKEPRKKSHWQITGDDRNRKMSMARERTISFQSDQSSERKKSLMALLGTQKAFSHFRDKVHSIRAFKELEMANLTLEPTFRVEPKQKFDTGVVKKVVQELVTQRLKDMKYSAKSASLMIKVMSEDIKDRCKELRFDRYKIVCMVTLGENKEQGLRVASRCEWNTEFDNMIEYSHQTPDMFCSVLVFGVYLD